MIDDIKLISRLIYYQNLYILYFIISNYSSLKKIEYI